MAEIEQLKARTGAQRLAEFLLELCPVESGSCAVRLPYDKALIAGRLGMKPESLSRGFSRLRKVGVVDHPQTGGRRPREAGRFAEEDPRWPGREYRVIGLGVGVQARGGESRVSQALQWLTAMP